MKKLICALIGAAALVASATTYIQTSSTGTAPWKPVKDSVSQAHLADSARHAPPSAYADSSRASGLADSAKRAGWAPLDSGRVRGIVGDTATVLRTYIGSASTTGNAATATKLATARTIATSGDVTGTPTNFDGTANITIPTTLPTLLTAGSAGSATTVPTLTWDAKGRLTAVGSAAISIPHTQISDWASSVSNVYLPLAGGTMTGSLFGSTSINIGASTNWWGSGYFTYLYVQNSPVLTANQSISLTGAVTGSGTTSIPTSFANTHLAGIDQDLTTTSSPRFEKVYGNVSGTGTSSFYGVTIAGGGSLKVNGTSTFYYASTFYQRLTAQDISACSIVPTTTAVYDLGSSSLVWHNVYASAMYEAGVSLSAKYAPIAVPSYFSTNATRTLSSQSGSVYVYTVSQTTTQTLQDGTVSGETITVKNAQNSSTLVLTGNINAGSSTITSLSTAVLVWNGSTWY